MDSLRPPKVSSGTWHQDVSNISFNSMDQTFQHIPQMLTWIEIWELWRLRQHLEPFVIFLNPCLNNFALWRGIYSWRKQPLPSGDTVALPWCTWSAERVAVGTLTVLPLHNPICSNLRNTVCSDTYHGQHWIFSATCVTVCPLWDPARWATLHSTGIPMSLGAHDRVAGSSVVLLWTTFYSYWPMHPVNTQQDLLF